MALRYTGLGLQASGGGVYDPEAMTMCNIFVVSLAVLGSLSMAQNVSLKDADAVYPDAYNLYVDLHAHPELSGHESETAVKLATALRKAGYDVTEHVGNTGVVAVMKNGSGPTVMLRTELDALPVEEKTGLPFASKVHVKDDAGHDVSVMHACGHDIHMAALLGAAESMARSKESWHGTLVLIGQPAEETIGGAEGMVRAGLFTRFPKPDVVVALHVGNDFPAGTVGIVPGVYNTNADSVRITIYGKGGHGAMPQATVDPIVVSARTIVALQTIASREVKPGEMAVVTVGYIHAGTKNNIIPDQAELGLTVRTRNREIRKQILASIERISKAEAAAANAPREPTVERYEGADMVYNDPKLAERLRLPLEAALGKDHVVIAEPITPSEDFSYLTEQGVPGFYLSLGGANAQKFADAKSSGKPMPVNHSPLFAPDSEPTIKAGIIAEIAMLKDLLKASPEELHKFNAEQPTH